jgi:hypothetical protein
MIRVVAAAFALCLFASLSLVAPARAHAADAPAEAWKVEVALVEENGDTVSALVALTERGCASGESHRGASHFKVTVCREPGGEGTPAFHFSVERRRGALAQGLAVLARPAPGQPTVIGSLREASASTEVRATVSR